MTGITSTGLGSGIDINGLVTKLVDAEKAPTTSRLDRQEATLQAKISALGNFKSSLSSLRDSLKGLKNLSVFRNATASTSDASALTASATTNADAGDYAVEIKKLAKSHALATAATFASANDVVGTGTLTIKFGTDPTGAGFQENADKGTLTLNIDSSNNTLTGIRDAINNANAGVSAAVIAVNDGKDYRLVLTSKDGGLKNALQIATSSSDGLSILDYNASSANMTETQTAQDADAVINGLSVHSSSNTLTGALKGVTLSLLQAQEGKIVNLSVARNNDDVVKAVNDFVTAYNDVLSTQKGIAGYDPSSKQAGILLGDPTVQGGVARLRSVIGGFVQGLAGSFRSLVDIGLSTRRDGSASLDSAKLSKALATDREGVAALFAVLGRPSDSGVTYLSAGASTAVGSYSVKVTQAAAQGALNGAAVAGASLVVDANNNAFTFKIDGAQSNPIALTQGTYTGASLAVEFQSRLNGDSLLKAQGKSVTVSFENDHFAFTSKTYGATSQVEIAQAGSGAAATLGLDVATGTAGLNVQGEIDGSAAQGSGQQLTAIDGPAKGLALLIGDAKTGDRGTVDFTRGLMDSLDKFLGALLDTKGTLAGKTDGLQKTLDRIADDRVKLDNRMSKLQTRLLAQFNAMDALLGGLQATSNYLAQQLGALPYSSGSSGASSSGSSSG
jgi:flagellar hook-associated protein 2